MNLPNKLTLLRIGTIPFFVACFFLPPIFDMCASAAVFGLAYATDAVDGHLARKRNQVTDFGKLMDPIADKLLSCAALVMLAALGMVHPVAVIIILSREFIINGMRLVCAEKGVIVAASVWGKLKTISQVVCILAVLLYGPLAKLLTLLIPSLFPAAPTESVLAVTAQVSVWISAALALVSGADYLYKNRSCFNTK